MAVVINEFEVVAEPAPPSQNGAPADQQGQAEPPPAASTPLDMERIIEQQLARLERVRAH